MSGGSISKAKDEGFRKRLFPGGAPKPGFVLYAVGISVWMTLVACSGTTYMFPLLPERIGQDTFFMAQQIAYVLTFFVVAAAALRHAAQSLRLVWLLTAAAFLVVEACLALITAGFGTPLLQGLFGAAMGVGTALGYMQWTQIICHREDDEVICLVFVSSLASIATSVILFFIPPSARLALYGLLLIPASLVLLRLNDNLPRKPIPHEPTALVNPKETRGKLARSIVIPTACAVVLTLVAPVASSLLVDTQGHDVLRMALSQTANLVTIVIFGLLYYALHHRPSIEESYAVLMPVLASSVLAATFLEPDSRWFVLFFGDMCFCAVSFLLLLTSCSLSKRLDISPMATYGILGGFVYLARVPEILVVTNPFASLSPAPSIVAAVLLYLLTVPIFLLPLAMRRGTYSFLANAKSQENEPAGHLPGQAPDNISARGAVGTLAQSHALLAETCKSIAVNVGLSERQALVMALLVDGEGAARIGDRLGLSENTVKTYRKAIYAALDVHSRQELRDYVTSRISRLENIPS